MTKIPTICLNPKCNTIFPSVFNLKALNASFKNVGMGPCPKCGGDGKIPDGSYSNFDDKIFAFLEDVNDIALFQKIAQAIQRDLKRNKSPISIKKKLTKQFPKHKSTWNLIPETKQDAYAAIQIILAIIMAVITIGTCSKENKEIIINQTYNNLYLEEGHESEQNIPFDNHTEDNSTQDKPIKI